MSSPRRCLIVPFSLLLFQLGAFFPALSKIHHWQKESKIAMDTTKDETYIRSGLIKYGDKDYEGALSDFNETIKRDPNNWMAYRYIGNTALKLKNYSNAIDSYSKAISIKPNDTLSFRGRAQAERSSDKVNEALRDYNVVLSFDPHDAVARFGRGLCYRGLKLYSKAVADLNYCIQRFPKNNDIYFQRAIVFFDAGNYHQAILDFNRSLKLGGKDNESIFYFRGMSYWHDDKPDSAIIDLKRHLIDFKDDHYGYVGLGLAYAEINDSIKSIKSYEKALELSTDNPNIFLSMSESLIKMRNFSKAKKILESELVKGRSSSNLFHLYGLAKKGTLDTLGALECFSKALEIDPKKKEVYESRMNFLIGSKKNWKFVKGDLDQLIKLNTDSFQVSRHYATRSFINFQLHDTITAKSDVDHAVRFLPDEPYPYIYRALINYYRMKKTYPSIIFFDLEKAISLNHSLSQSYLIKAIVYNEVGEIKEACKALQKAIQYGAIISSDVKHSICKGKLKDRKELGINFKMEYPKYRTTKK